MKIKKSMLEISISRNPDKIFILELHLNENKKNCIMEEEEKFPFLLMQTFISHSIYAFVMSVWTLYGAC